MESSVSLLTGLSPERIKELGGVGEDDSSVRPARPTLREDLKLPLPPAREPLDELDHPILAKAREHFADDEAGHERIRSVDDEVLFKVKVQRWSGAVWAGEDLPWLIAAGQPEDGSPDDFLLSLGDDREGCTSPL
ncbi:hypothetical protein ACOT81_24975 [Streptomyces sp. WI04-05B]|uniref:hypothetical protein n=1 Tax=Streptomyces TaxID=1883 RepID=UPI0029B15BAF|nr:MULTISPECIES: hypothetical protein [unclassified Streptomyces]MDX2548759.1 hypothetical protein [Streptomyces sp. WI04-05B]MDX2590436.1 hypothetical protein [Streptomyces sp. WI04-05A]MDX3747518.1 hypothetical protein [Streptomyces sp. AK08-02]